MRLLRGLLDAGYLEDWRFHQTSSGTPQGGICSPILTNIYLHRLDTYVTESLIPRYTRGVHRRKHRAYFNLLAQAYGYRKRGNYSVADICEKRVGARQVHALRHTFARALEDAGAKVSEIQAQLGHESLDTTGRYLARLHQAELRHHARLAAMYGLAAPAPPVSGSAGDAAPTE